MIRKILSFLALLVSNGLRLRFAEAVGLKNNFHNSDSIAVVELPNSDNTFI